MVFNHEVLFIHLGKTGGMSVTHYMCNVLKPPVISVINKQFQPDNQIGHEIRVVWKRHGTLVQSRHFLKKYGLQLSGFKLIFCMVRDPVDMEYSYYKHLRKESVISRLSTERSGNQRLACAQNSFDHFARLNFTHFVQDLKDYFTVNGKVPDNMKIIRFEEMPGSVTELLAPYAMKEMPFPHKNRSREKMGPPELSEEGRMNIRKKYAWIYENGFY
nr:sulfotransferase domain-containing protein [Bacteroidota bacterium]